MGRKTNLDSNVNMMLHKNHLPSEKGNANLFLESIFSYIGILSGILFAGDPASSKESKPVWFTVLFIMAKSQCLKKILLLDHKTI